MVKKGADFHAREEEALTNAAYNGHLDIVKFLVEKGANLHIRKESALGLAAWDGNLEIVKYLIEQGAVIEVAINQSIKYKSPSVVKLLSTFLKK